MSGNRSDIYNPKISSVLITGGNGFVGSRVTTLLISKGFKVSHLSVNPKPALNVPVYAWSPVIGEIDKEAFNGIDCIIHLAGANIGEKRWTKQRKEEIIKSRVDSAQLLFKTVTDLKIELKAFISASAVGYYGSKNTNEIFSEESLPSTDFLGETCRLWEKNADLFEASGIRTVKIRTGIVLDKNEGALAKLYLPARYGIVLRTGSGHQYMPWIHISDLCNIYLKAIEDSNMSGAYNAVSPQHIDHNNFVRTMAASINRSVFLPAIPSFIFKIFFGQMSTLFLKGSRVSSKKISESGYDFLFPDLKGAFNEIFSK